MSKYLPSVLLIAAALVFLSPSGCPSINLPIPIVQPKYESIYVVVVENGNTRSVEAAKVLNDVKLLDAMKAAKANWIIYNETKSDGSPNPEATPYASQSAIRPLLLVMTDQGSVLHKDKLPATSDGLKAVVNGFLKEPIK